MTMTIEQKSFENSKNWMEIDAVSEIVVYHDPDYDTIWLVYQNSGWGASRCLGVIDPNSAVIDKEADDMLHSSF